VVLEHATTKEAVDYVLAHPTVGCTITPQHLLYNRNALLVGGLKPHFYCLPILKREVHRTPPAACPRRLLSPQARIVLVGTRCACLRTG
jgi:dihydroorotase